MGRFLSIDPGIGKGTGLVLWENGKPIDWTCIKIPYKLKGRKLSLCKRLVMLKGYVTHWLTEVSNGAWMLGEVTIEKAHIHTPKQFIDKMFNNTMAIGVLGAMFTAQGIPVYFITKRPEDHKVGGRVIKGKEPGRLTAESLGVKGPDVTEHEQDAAHLGCLRGYDRKNFKSDLEREY